MLGIKNNQIQDVSFINVFFKKFVIYLIVVALCSMILLNIVPAKMETFAKNDVDAIISQYALQIAEFADKDAREDINETTNNILLAQLQNELLSSKYVTNAAASLYDLSNSKVIANSKEVLYVASNDAKTWWKEENKTENGEPSIVLSSEALEFCRKYKNETLFTKGMFFVNGLLSPTNIIVKDRTGKEIQRFDIDSPTLSSSVEYENLMQIKLNGNNETDVLYKQINNVVVKKDALLKKDDAEQGSGEDVQTTKQNSLATVTYIDKIDTNKINLKSTIFEINGNTYQMDCLYTMNFWSDSITEVLLCELCAVLLCALVAFISTKSVLKLHS